MVKCFQNGNSSKVTQNKKTTSGENIMMKIKELLITNEEQDGNNVILTLKSGEKVTMSNNEYESMITSGLDEMLDDMFPEPHAE